MEKTKLGRATHFVETFLQEKGFERLDRMNNAIPNGFFCGTLPSNPKTLTYVFSSAKKALEVFTLMKELDWPVTPRNGRAQQAVRIGIKGLLKIMPTSPEEGVILVTTNEAPQETGLFEKCNEQMIIESLLNDNSIAFTLGKIDKKDIGFNICLHFSDENGFVAAATLFSSKKMDYADDEKGLYMYVSLALPDALLNGEISHEDEAQKGKRKIREYDVRLHFMLQQKLDLIIREPIGTVVLVENQIRYSGDNGTRRIDFSTTAIKERTKRLLETAGFSCKAPATNEPLTLIINLEESHQRVLTQDVEGLLMTADQIREKLASQGLIESSCGRKTVEGVRLMVFFFQNPQESERARKVLVADIPSVTTYLRGLRVPLDCIDTKRGGGHRPVKEDTPKAIAQPVKKLTPPVIKELPVKKVLPPVTKAVSLTDSASHLIAFTKALECEIEAKNKDRIRELENQVAELTGALETLKQNNYVVPKTKGETITIPLQELSTGGVAIASSIVIKKALIFK